MVRKKTRIVAVANEKGGVGKTAMVVNLGAALSREGQKVLVIDMDPQANATSGLGIEPDDGKATIYDLLINENGYTAKDAICPTKWKHLSVIASHIDLSGAEVELVDAEGRENRLKEAIAGIAGDYDVIIMDTPPSLSLLTINVFSAATEVLVPCQTQPYAYRALADLFDTISDIREEINPGLKISGIVPTFFDTRTRISREIMERLRENERYRPFVYQTAIRMNTTIAASADAGKPVIFYRTGSYGAEDFQSLALEFLKSA